MCCRRILASITTGELAKELWVSVTAISVIHACCSEGPVSARGIDLFAAAAKVWFPPTLAGGIPPARARRPYPNNPSTFLDTLSAALARKAASRCA